MFIILTIFAILIGFFLYKGYKNTQTVVMNHIKVETNPHSSDKTTLRILHISDMHIENISITPQQLFENLRNQSFDMIALTGDFLDRKRSIPNLIPYLQVFSQLKPVYGAYAVFGNHDYVLKDQSFNQLKKTLNEYGVITLQNEHEMIDVDGKALNIIGIDNYSTSHSNLPISYDGLVEGYNLVLTHDPNIILIMEDYHFDYMLSGHFHGGQIYWPKPYHLLKMGKLVRMNMVKGLHQYHGRSFYISEGLGQTGVNIRIGSRPEITIHNLYLYKQEEENKRVDVNNATIKAG